MQPITDFNNWVLLSESVDQDMILRMENLMVTNKSQILMLDSEETPLDEIKKFLEWVDSYAEPLVLCQIQVPYMRRSFSGYYVLLDHNKVMVLQADERMIFFLVEKPL